MHEIDKTKFRLYKIKKNWESMRLMKENHAIKNWINILLFLII